MSAWKRNIDPEIGFFLLRFWAATADAGLTLRQGADVFRCPLSTWARVVNGKSEPHASVYLRMKRWLDIVEAQVAATSAPPLPGEPGARETEG